MIRSFFSFFGGIFALFTLGAALAAILAVGVFFAYGKDLPDHEQLATYEPATISRVYSIDGRVVDEFAQERRFFTPEDEIPAMIKQAFISAEDKNFYDHAGYDPAGIAKAVYDAAQGAPLRGASTITQQVMKNFLLDGTRSVERKIKEIILASRIENTLEKDDILELYLNEIFLGQNSYGVTAAAETYFGKPLEDVTLEEAAYLAALPKAPSKYHPVREREAALGRRNFVLREMFENGYIEEDVYQTAKASDLKTVQSGDFVSARSLRPPRSYFTDEIRRQLSKSFGEEEFFTGGMAVRATMDPDLQRLAENALRQGLEVYDRERSPYRGPVATFEDVSVVESDAWRDALTRMIDLPRDVEGWNLAVVKAVTETGAVIGIEGVAENDNQVLSLNKEKKWAANREYEDGTRVRVRASSDLWAKGDIIHVKAERGDDGAVTAWSLRQIPELQGAFMAMDTETGRVLAMQGGFSYQYSVFNRATQALRQPGSSFKPFVYAAALDSGYSPISIIVDAPIEIDTPQGVWRPKNASNQFYGPAPMRVGIEQSRNLMTVRLAQDVGMDVIAGYAKRFGVYDNMQPLLSASLGAQETTLFQMVSSYAMFANGGERVHPTLVDRVQDRFGRNLFVHDRRDCIDCEAGEITAGLGPRIVSNRERVLDPVTAYRLTSMMRGVVDRGTATRVRMNGVQLAGKTGTTNDAKDVWFIGFTRNIVAGCYMGFDDPRSLGRGAFGGRMCGPVFKAFMEEAVKKYGSGKFEVPENTYFAKFDRFSGAQLPSGASGPNVIAELFRTGEDPLDSAGLLVIDGGFSASADIEIFEGYGISGATTDKVVTSGGKQKTISGNAGFGSITSGGVY
ncbi:MAG: PBP1A family penicillin-binding protein [Pseudomonadota bacterium]